MGQLLTKEEQIALDRVKPICAECKHYLEPEYASPKCTRTDSIQADRISGGVSHSYRSCDIERGLGLQQSCGKQGRFFEPMPPKQLSWIERLIAWVN